MAHLTLADIARRTAPGDRPMAKKKFMKSAFANSHGQFKAKAARAGMSTRAFAEKEKSDTNASTKTKRQANLALAGMNSNHKRSRSERFYGKD